MQRELKQNFVLYKAKYIKLKLRKNKKYKIYLEKIIFLLINEEFI